MTQTHFPQAGKDGQHEAVEAVVRARQLSKHFGDLVALDKIDLSIPKGQVVALLGPNGAGKTTLTNLLLGRHRADAGRCEIFGLDTRDQRAREKVGCMLQVAEVPGTLTVAEHIAAFSRYYPTPRPLAETLKLAGLDELSGQRFATLSGGQKQRLLFAFSICGRPELILLDEPSVGLDVESRRQFWQVIRNLRDTGTSVLLTTHYIEEADALADYVYVLVQGKIVAAGDPATIKQQTRGRIIRCRSRVPVSLISARQEINHVSTEPQGGGTMALEIHSSQVETTLRFMLNEDPQLSDLSLVDAGLEQAFLDIVERQKEVA